MNARVLTDPMGLAEAILGAPPPVVLDIRWRLGADDGVQRYRSGHIPGAVYVDLDSELAAPASTAEGRHPLPALADLQTAARRWGIDDDVPVVVYDDSGNLAAARAWWLLRWAGIADVTLLDGGLAAWEAAGLRLSQGDTTPRRGAVNLTAGSMPVVGIDTVAETAGVVLDARAAQRYSGETEPIDPRPGHIPGALSAPTADNLTAAECFRSTAELIERFAAYGLDPGDTAITYCGSGINAAHQIAALEIAGITGILFPGSWSQWSADPTRLAVIGDRPHAST